MTNQSEAQRVRAKAAQLKSVRDSSWTPKWKDCRDYLSPNDGVFAGDRPNDGKRKDGQLVDKHAVGASLIMAAGMTSGMASQARPWFVVSAPNGVPQSAAVKRWLYDVQTSMRSVLAKSNLYTVLPQVFKSEGVFGTGCMAGLPDPDDVVRFYHYPIGTYAIDYSSRGIIDTFYREFTMTPRQMAQQFGKEALSVGTRQAAECGNLTPVTVCHLIEPNPDADMRKADKLSMPYRSTYWELGSTEDKTLSVGGFKVFPVMCPRWHVNGQDSYGTGPGDVAFGYSRELQALSKDKLRIIQQLARPAFTGPLSMRGMGSSFVPGGMSWVPDQLVGVGFKPVYTPDSGSIAHLRVEIEEAKRAIDSAFFVDLFLMISQSDGQMTATEVIQRKEEKMLMLGTVVERNNDELFDPLMDMVFQYMVDKSIPVWEGLIEGDPLIPEPPEELAGQPLSIEYISVLAQAQKAIAVSNIERAVQFTGLAAQLGGPEALDAINTDEAQSAYFDAIGAPPSMLRSPEEIQAIREARAQAQAQAAQAEQAAQLVQGAKTMADTPTSGDNLLSAMTGL